MVEIKANLSYRLYLTLSGLLVPCDGVMALMALKKTGMMAVTNGRKS